MNRLRPSELAIAILLYALFLTGCSAKADLQLGPDREDASWTLNNGRPQLELRVDRNDILRSSGVLEITIVSIDNPGLTPFSIALFLDEQHTSDTAGSLAIGAFTVYPPDQPGTFAVRLPENLGAELPADLRLILQLQPISSASELSPLTVEIESPVWR